MDGARPPEAAAHRTRASWAWFTAWVLAGAGAAFGILAAFTIGIFVVPVAGGAIAFLATRRRATDGVAGLISGLGLPVLYVGYLNRAGPGDVCTVTKTGSTCTQEWSPWPWLTVGGALLVVGVAVFVISTRQRPARDA